MRTYQVVLFISLLLVFCENISAQYSPHIILISIDGLNPKFYLDERYSTPTIQQIKKEGSFALQMRSVFPSYTYPAHAAMITGTYPARSGIYYNGKLESDSWNWFTSDIKSPTLWDAAKNAGLTTAAIQWPISVGKEITYNIPEIWNPESPHDRIRETRKYATKGLIEEIEINATGKLDSINMSEAFLGLDDNAGRIAAHILKKYKPNLLAVHFAGVDGRQHEHGRDHEKVRHALANVDHAIGVILEAVESSGLKDSTTILIVGDHGFADIHTVIRPNVLLQQRGLSGKARFQPAGGSAFLYLENKSDSTTLNEVIKVLENVDEQQYFSIYNKEKLVKMGADPNAVLALAAKPGYVFSGGITKEVTSSPSGGHHGYDPNLPEMMTGFIASGSGINKGVVIKDMCVTDIAPLIAVLLGIKFSTPDGKLISNLLKSN